MDLITIIGLIGSVLGIVAFFFADIDIKIKSIFIFILLVAIFLLGGKYANHLFSNQPSTSKKNQFISPYEIHKYGIEEAVLGMKIKDFEKKFRTDFLIKKYIDGDYYENYYCVYDRHSNEELYCIFSKDMYKSIWGFRITNEKFSTKNGIRPKMTLEKYLEIYPESCLTFSEIDNDICLHPKDLTIDENLGYYSFSLDVRFNSFDSIRDECDFDTDGYIFSIDIWNGGGDENIDFSEKLIFQRELY